MSSSPSGSPSSTTNNTTFKTGIIMGGIVLIVTVCSITKCIIKKSRMQSTNAPTQETNSHDATTPTTSSMDSLNLEMESMNRFLDDILKEKPMRFTPQHLKEFTHNYEQELGSGGFGVVYKGRFPNGVRVAVKVLHGTLDKRAEEQFMAEIGTVGRTYHINLVRLYGFCFETTVKALVYEYMENGSLDRYLFNGNQGIEWEKQHEIAIGTAKGIRYLHEECEKRIIHYDIKPGNVLLTANFSPKVADFGLAKLCNRESTHVIITRARGTPGYAAPELWLPFPVTHKCDVYSFGMLLFEILGQRRNLELKHTESQEWYPRWVWQKFEKGQLDVVLSVSRIEAKDRAKAERMFKVALWCIQYEPEERPSMGSVVRILEGEEEIIAPRNPFAHMAPYGAGSALSSENTSYLSG
ncbi:G-type lectin S-receptor-like serine/threonine-protein kinase At5g24080 [Elaeis guineensis]|uniref:G-type lectin S-receptor-like serine/threonine-protein kinase At5g24080 n=1 Tax=Elaeis guineensis var. tenera TaxID=51953 RepID=A0A6J0PEG0_ELAGV|nr:G-type lectin S-receptor-like serine/threonine-protein kinase At5g24080 [Elaeis guineensis]